MADKWKTTRRCHDCLMKGDTYYLEAQKWTKDNEGRQQFRLTCPGCGYSELTKWEGR